ncbi:MAG: YqeG family HAD IIIA-type phosphatase [Armatimonadota bacterium]
MNLISMLKWDEYAESVAEIDPAVLAGRGIKVLLCDLDNTLVPWHTYDILDEVREWLARVREAGIRVCIVSNSRYSKRRERLAGALGLPYTKRGLKPRRGGFREALAMFGADPSEAAVIGDQVFTDILGGNRLGARTILVTPLSKREFFATKITRMVERALFELLSRGVEQSSNIDRQMKTRYRP